MVKLVMGFYHKSFKVMEFHYGSSRVVRLVLKSHHIDF